MSSRHHRPAVFDRPSPSIFGLIVLTAFVFSIFFFPFIFHAYGPTDNPFDKPMELLWLAIMTTCLVPVLLAIVIARRKTLEILGK